jgi:hypothetical protein
MTLLSRWCALVSVILVFYSLPADPQYARQTLPQHVPSVVYTGVVKPLGPLPSTRRLNLAIVLPLRNQD